VQLFISEKLYLNYGEKFVSVFQIEGLSDAPYKAMSGLLTFLYPMLKEFIIEGAK
jgi:hypothetical protein